MIMKSKMIRLFSALTLCCLIMTLTNCTTASSKAPTDKVGTDKHIVLISGDDEYRSEESMPMLAKILRVHHGFKCTVLFAANPKGHLDVTYQKSIPGLEALKTADLMMIFTRFRDLPNDQMKHVDDYLLTGKPVIGLRTSTHAFRMNKTSQYYHYTNGYNGPKKEWKGGFGKLV
jgi:hypothetical protein